MRQAGQSLRALFNQRRDSGLEWIAMFVLAFGYCLGVFTGYWVRDAYPFPHLLTLVLPVIAAIRMWQWKRGFDREAANMILGLQGEQHVADRLNELRIHGYRVYDDIPSEREGGANVDHLAIGPGGIFVIETKTRSLPETRQPIVTYDGQTLLVDGYRPDRDPIGQVKAIAREVCEWLHADTGRDVSPFVRPVVVFPGWTIDESRRKRPYYEWVLNPGSLLTFIRNEPRKLSPEDAALYSSRIEQRVRRHQAEALRRP